MKKAFAIGLLAIFLFNVGGYYVFFWALKTQANKELSVKLDQGVYNENETFEIKIPLSLPYPLQSNDYQRQTGHFTYKQEHYQLVKQKYANDTLTIVAIKDVQSNQLTAAMDSFSEASGNQSDNDGTLNIPTKVLSEYLTAFTVELSSILGWSRSVDYTPYFAILNHIDILKDSPPPKFS